MTTSTMKLLQERFPYKVPINIWEARDKSEEILAWLYSNFGKDNHGFTFTGPVEYDTVMSSTWVFLKEEDALAFKLAWQSNRVETLLIDPPSGWRYGFPKVIPESELHRAEDWMVENGYPQKEIDQFGSGNVPYRILSGE